MTDRDRELLDLAFGALISGLGGGGDRSNMYPSSDVRDQSLGARFIPGQVTLARRAGKTVTFVNECGSCCWYWQMPDGTRIYHFDRYTYEQIARANGQEWEGQFHGDAGSCPHCGNPHTNGGIVGP